MTRIHFICRGNVYRSRLAEAYARSLLRADSNVEISSSGIEASLNLNGNVDPDTVKALEADHIGDYLVPNWRQTTQELIDGADVLVFVSGTVYRDATQSYKLPRHKCIVWHIKDVDNIYPQVKDEVGTLMKDYL